MLVGVKPMGQNAVVIGAVTIVHGNNGASFLTVTEKRQLHIRPVTPHLGG